MIIGKRGAGWVRGPTLEGRNGCAVKLWRGGVGSGFNINKRGGGGST